MTATYDAIATTTLGTTAFDIIFSSIPNTYTDLRVVWSGTQSSALDNLVLSYNNTNLSSTAYSETFIAGDGSTVYSSRATSSPFVLLTDQALSTSIPYFVTIDVFNYAGSTNKTCLVTSSEDLNGSGRVSRRVGLYRSTNAISTLKISTLNAAMRVGTTATLYGIKAE